MTEQSPKTMFYLHVPKTGGQTLATRLASGFDPDKVRLMQEPLRSPKDVEKLGQLLREKHFIESHVGGALLSDRSDLDILCTVREPIEQMLSSWRHIRREKENRWHRASRLLSPADFFDSFGEDYVDHQTNYILSAFNRLSSMKERDGYYRAINANFQKSLDRIRWLVPTESIDEFVDLWIIETKRQIPNRLATINVAHDDGSNVAEARAALLARPRLYAYDQVLHQIARDRFHEYKRQIYDLVAPWSYPEDSRRAFKGESGGVWLTKNWYDPEIADGQRAWWAGPHRVSEVRFWRANNEQFLKFNVLVVNGIEFGSIVVRAKESSQVIKTVRTPIPSVEGMEYSVPLTDLKEKDTILITAPHCFAPILVREDDPSVVRRSFLASGWTLV